MRTNMPPWGILSIVPSCPSHHGRFICPAACPNPVCGARISECAAATSGATAEATHIGVALRLPHSSQSR